MVHKEHFLKKKILLRIFPYLFTCTIYHILQIRRSLLILIKCNMTMFHVMKGREINTQSLK